MYYVLNGSYFKLDSQKTFFEHVNNSNEDKIIVHGTKVATIEAMHNSISTWTVITEEEYNTVKAEVLAFLSAN